MAVLLRLCVSPLPVHLGLSYFVLAWSFYLVRLGLPSFVFAWSFYLVRLGLPSSRSDRQSGFRSVGSALAWVRHTGSETGSRRLVYCEVARQSGCPDSSSRRAATTRTTESGPTELSSFSACDGKRPSFSWV